MRSKEAMALLALVGLSASCSGTSNGTTPSDSMPDADLSGGSATIDGGAYPTANIGGQPRTATQAGQIFPNLTLEGVRSAATVNTPVMVSMAEFYDPDGLSYDLLHVMAIFMWCPHCNNETNNLSKIAAWQADHRIAVVQIAMEGYGGASPGWSELQKWVSDHKLNFPVLVDGQGAQLGQYFSVDYVPINIVVNPRTMEILAVDVGDVGDVQGYEQGFLN